MKAREEEGQVLLLALGFLVFFGLDRAELERLTGVPLHA